MKAKRFLFPILMAFSIGFTSCGGEETNSCDGVDVGDDFGCPADIDAVATLCSDGINNTYYTYGGNTYTCTGVEASTCDQAIADIGAALIEQGCSAKKSGDILAGKAKLSSLAENLLLEVKSKSLCN